MTNYTINIHICQVLLENMLIFMRELHKYRFVEMLWNDKKASDLLVETMKTYKPKDGEIGGCATSTCVSAVPGAKKLSPHITVIARAS
jgi:hypothetical protein